MAVRSHQYFSLRWNNYQNTMTSVFQQLREDQSFVDVTLSCENGSLKAHKVVLSACSSYFQKLLLENPCKHPTIILPSDIIFTDLKTIIDFVYRGEIDVTESELQGLLRTAEQLKIKGLCETAETTDDLSTETASTTTITVPETISTATGPSTITNIATTNVSANSLGVAVAAGTNTLTGQQQHQQQHIISNTQRKSRIRKRSKSPDSNQQILGTTATGSSTGGHTGYGSPAIVNLNTSVHSSAGGGHHTTTTIHHSPNSSHTTVSGGHIGGITSVSSPSTADSNTDDITTSKPTKICKTENSSSTNNGNGVVTPATAIVTQIVVARDSKDKNMTSLGMGMNGGLLGVPMGFLDFAPEPPAPSATPVTEHVDMSCPPSADTRDLSNPTETLDIDNHIAHHIIHRLDQSPMHQMQHQGPQTPTSGAATTVAGPGSDDNNSNLIQNIKSEVVEVKQHHIQQQQQHQHQQQQHQQQQQQQHQHQQQNQGGGHQHQTTHHQDITGSTVMEIDPSNIKHEPGMIITPEIVTMMTTGHMDIYNSDTSEDSLMIANGSPNDNNEPHYTNLDQQQDAKGAANGAKTWTQEDMNSALDALKNQNMSLTKASVTYGIPSTTLWQRAHRMGIDTPKKEANTKSWNEEALNNALEALRTGQISANKASKAYGIPSSTLYKIARREGIRLAAPFNAAPTTWTPEDLERALEAIRAGHTSVQKASTEFGIPTGTLYGRCKREGIELSRSNPTPWSEDAMNEALVAVRVGHMSINQAAIHYNLPYSSLYGRFKRGKFDSNVSGSGNNSTSSTGGGGASGNTSGNLEIIEHSPENSMHVFQQFQYSPGPSSTQSHHQQTSQQQAPPHHQSQHQQQQTHHLQHLHQQHLQQQQDIVTSTSQVHAQQGQIQQIYHHHSTPERS